jgi:CRP-like cAMP-binding protein
VPASCFAARLSDFTDLSTTERAALDRLEERERNFKRGTLLIRENDPAQEVFVLRQGMMISYTLLDNGSRQILRFLFPGDMIGASSMVCRDMPESVVALTDCTVAPIEKANLVRLASDHPRLAALMVVYDHVERMMLTDRLAALGRASARARVATILLELRERRRKGDPTITDRFRLGLTQEEIGDATGLTAVHVNRMIRQLEDEGLIARERGELQIRDEAGLCRAANFVNRYDNLDLSWMPPAQ